MAYAIHTAPLCAALIEKVSRIMDKVLHLGAHRTGTTSFQTFLKRNRAALSRRGIAVWEPDQIRSGLFQGVLHDPAQITADVARLSERSRGRIKIEQSRLVKTGADTLIISDENFIGTPMGNLRSGRLYDDAILRLMRLRTAIGRVRSVTLTVRSYDSYWSSILSFGLMRGKGIPTNDDLDRLVTQPRRWRDLIADVAQVFPDARLIVAPFETFATAPKALAGQIVNADLSGADIDDAPIWKNASANCGRLAQVIEDRGCGGTVAGAANERWMPFDAHQRAALAGQYADDLMWLKSGADGVAEFIDTADAPLRRHNKLTGIGAMHWSPTIGGTEDGKQRYLV
ncbi:hypothetical protein BVC71_10945 [Marivivens niveibacter]|uniref:Sulfotransferase family protein n=1 Tax=Marivivens niveibacter TaxID=1930667 RepID=A0A251WXI8_9RHOB|nr:hypothetical protein [Marivivens niveibacter]OUD09210.1 hypothetical protein BVC71_10945 [Marivivens niveibacter]